MGYDSKQVASDHYYCLLLFIENVNQFINNYNVKLECSVSEIYVMLLLVFKKL